MLSSIGIPTQTAESPWQDLSSHASHPLDPQVETQIQDNQEHFIDPAIISLNEEAPAQDNNRTLTQLTAAHLAPLVELHMHFQDLPNFIRHSDFDHFAYCWMEGQHYIGLSKHIEYRPIVVAWFASSSVQLASIASNYPSYVPNEDSSEASTPHIKAAYQRLVQYFRVMHKVIDTIEQGRLNHRSPQEVMLPIFNQLLEKSFSQQQIITSSNHHQDRQLTYQPPVPGVSISEPPSLSHPDAPTQYVQPFPLEFPPDHLHLLSYEYLSLSSPDTSNSIDTMSSMFLNTNQQYQNHQQSDQTSSLSSLDLLSPSPPTDTIKSEEDKSEFMSTTAPMDIDSDRHHNLEDPIPDEQDSDYQQGSIEEDDEYDEGEGDDMYQTTPKGKAMNANAIITARRKDSIHHHHKSQQSEAKNQKMEPVTRHNLPRRGRTATSYDDDTTQFLKAMFFNIYSQRDKLTKDQRRLVVEKTGLKPRNVTYWFSNHKRRFQAALNVFKKLVAESNGRIQTYDDFIEWRRENGLPEDITDTRT